MRLVTKCHYHKMKLLCEESVERDGQAQYRNRQQSTMPALEDVCVWIVQY
jgi:hypothetical protein